MGHFIVKAKNKLSEMNINDRISESDFATLTPDGQFVQLEYKEDEEKKLEPYKVNPGIWAIQKTMAGLVLYKTSFAEDSVLETFVQTKNITDKIDCFFNKQDIYKQLYPKEIPVRRMLLYGPAGTGKTTSIVSSVRKYATDGKTAVIVWHTDKFEAYMVKDFIKSFEYIGVERLMLIAEDIGGAESENSRPSESSLLSLLDNKETTFTIPTMIIATTNYPSVFKGNLTNRPGRFADKIKVGFPSSNARRELFKFFAQDKTVTDDLLELIATDKCKQFTADHLKECFVRSMLYDKTLKEVINELITEIADYNKQFADTGGGRMGIFND